MRPSHAVAATALVCVAGDAGAQSALPLDLPAGTAGRQLLALGARARVSIAVPDRQLWNMRVPALRGRMTLVTALRRIAAEIGANVVAIRPASFELVRRPLPPQRPRIARLPPARAMPRPEPAPETAEIVVTASKRGVERRDFPGQASWIEGAMLDLGGAGGTERVVDRLTSVASTYLGAGRNKLFIRGIADSSFTGATQPTVGQYFGDLRLNYIGPDPGLRLIDLAGVEVLEGPQGTLYGAGSLGGLIRIIPNVPDLRRTGGSVGVGASSTWRGAPGGDTQGVLNLPLASGRLGLRLAAIVDSEGGYIDRPLLGRRDTNRTRTLGGRGTLRLAAGGGWTVDLTAMCQQIRGADSQYADGDDLSRASIVPEAFRAGFAQGQLAVTGRLGVVEIQSTGGMTWNELTEQFDATVADQPVRLFSQANRTRMIANETRFWQRGAGGAGWLVGWSYLGNRARTTQRLGAPGNTANDPLTLFNTAKEATLYGEVGQRLSPPVLATAGLRISRTTSNGQAIGTRPDEPDTPSRLSDDTTHPQRGRRTVILPSASVLVDLTPAARGFVRYQRGFRPAGVAVSDDRARPFQGDTVDTIEAGVRTLPKATRSTDFAFTVAYTDWRNIQADFLDGRGLPSTANIGNGRLFTFEASTRLRLAPGLQMTAALSYNESSIGRRQSRPSSGPLTDDLPPGNISAQLQRIPNIPAFTGRLGVTYDRSLDVRHALRIDTWVRYVGASSLGIGPILGQRQGDYLDSAVMARLARDDLGLTIGVSNLADARGNRFALGTPVTTGRPQVTPIRPRTIRIAIDTSF